MFTDVSPVASERFGPWYNDAHGGLPSLEAMGLSEDGFSFAPPTCCPSSTWAARLIVYRQDSPVWNVSVRVVARNIGSLM